MKKVQGKSTPGEQLSAKRGEGFFGDAFKVIKNAAETDVGKALINKGVEVGLDYAKNKLKNGKSPSGEQLSAIRGDGLFGDLGQNLGLALGGSKGGPLGAIVGSQLGNVGGSKIDKLLGTGLKKRGRPSKSKKGGALLPP
jgi:hypothetical protein